VIVVDTNVVSELMRPKPSSAVVNWVDSQPADKLYTTAVTVAEIRYGIERLPEGERRDLLAATLADVFTTFAERVLPFDLRAAARYGTIVAGRERAGAPITGFDAQIAAICQSHEATLATRNGKDFDATGVEVVDPWQATPPREPLDRT
jgi:toxin FitB